MKMCFESFSRKRRLLTKKRNSDARESDTCILTLLLTYNSLQLVSLLCYSQNLLCSIRLLICICLFIFTDAYNLLTYNSLLLVVLFISHSLLILITKSPLHCLLLCIYIFLFICESLSLSVSLSVCVALSISICLCFLLSWCLRISLFSLCLLVFEIFL